MPKNSWKHTNLYKELKKKNDKYSLSILNLIEDPKGMDKIELILDKGGTTPKDFTLHDADHSFRVAERMWNLIPDETKNILSGYEIGFLLLSAYLHDIGMSPDFDKVERHHRFISTDDKTCLESDEIAKFQKWIDDDENALSVDIKKDIITNNNDIDYIIAFYTRHMHNDWSGEWIFENLKSETLNNYPHWELDLIKLCKSHHYGLEKLVEEKFDPVFIGDVIIHLRYLAIILRIADVLENDPERTPDVILKHRKINVESRKYWIKDHFYQIIRNGNKFSLNSRPERAYIHNAIEQTARLIENEFKLCSQLILEKPLNHTVTKDLVDYNWVIEPTLITDIKAKDGCYEYIQGGFRPNTNKILELLGGNQLYGNPIWAYRELIQNAFDAVKEKIAYEILAKNLHIENGFETLGNLNEIKIDLVKNEDSFWLICKDTGVGMTKAIIERFFLESGSSNRHELVDLERKCKERGFNFERTGQFGIGVLSYFMLADKIIVITKREQNTGYGEEQSLSWRFEINGALDFGELKKINHSVQGTEIHLKIKKEFFESINEWDNKFELFLKEHIARTPCSLQYNSHFKRDKHYKINTGWTNSSSDIKEKVLNNMFNKLEEHGMYANEIILTTKQENESFVNKELIKKCKKEIDSIIDFLFIEEQVENVGKLRIHIPFFKLAKGNCFFYFKEEINDVHKILYVNRGCLALPEFNQIHFSLKGVNLNVEKTHFISEQSLIRNAYIEFNIESIDFKNLSVSRHLLKQDANINQIYDLVNKKIKDILKENKSNFENIYSSLNRHIVDLNFNQDNEYWISEFKYLESDSKNNGFYVWEKVNFPCTELTYSLIGKKFSNNNETLKLLSSISSMSFNSHYEGLLYFSKNAKLGILKNKNEDKSIFEIRNLYPVISKDLVGKLDFHKREKQIILPENWNNVLLFKDDIYGKNMRNFYFNPKYIDFHLFDYDKFYSNFFSIENELNHDLLSKTDKFNLLIAIISKYEREQWTAICEKNERLIKNLFKDLNYKEVIYLENTGNLVIYSLGSIKYLNKDDEIKKYLKGEVSEDFYLI